MWLTSVTQAPGLQWGNKSHCQHKLSGQTDTLWFTISDMQKHSSDRTFQEFSPKLPPQGQSWKWPFLGVFKVQAVQACWMNPFSYTCKSRSFDFLNPLSTWAAYLENNISNPCLHIFWFEVSHQQNCETCVSCVPSFSFISFLHSVSGFKFSPSSCSLLLPHRIPFSERLRDCHLLLIMSLTLYLRDFTPNVPLFLANDRMWPLLNEEENTWEIITLGCHSSQPSVLAVQ